MVDVNRKYFIESLFCVHIKKKLLKKKKTGKKCTTTKSLLMANELNI